MLPIRFPRRTAAAWIAMLLLAAPASSGRAQSHHDHETAQPTDLAPQFSIHGFSDVVLRVERNRPDDGSDSTSSGFALGQFDLFLISRLGPNLSFLGESVFEMEESGESVVDVERVFVKYAWSDFFAMAVGRTHTALGYWNDAFHHGGLLQPTVERPAVLEFEDDGGILPVHAVGIELSGHTRGESWEFDYAANVANGRGTTDVMVQGGGDLNRDKAVGLKLSFAHPGSGFAFGPSVYRDRIPAAPATPGREREIDEFIGGVHMHVARSGYEILAEYYRVRHDVDGGGEALRHDGWYAIALVGSGRIKPYAGIDRLTVEPGDPFYTSGQSDLTRGILGLRFQTSPFNAIKLELDHDERRGETHDAVLLQTAFTF